MSSQSSSYDSPSPPRENLWKGSARTWQQFTEEERGQAESLDELRNRDLSVHLYNAFALKRKINPSDQDKDNGGNSEEFDESNGFKLPQNWTAWPLMAKNVPREGEQIGPDDEDDIFTLKRSEIFKPSREMEDILTGVTLKYAKEQFLQRKSEESDEVDIPDDDDEGLKALSEPPSSKPVLRPVVSADDERSREILRPSIRHTLSKLDEVLMALHHARNACHRCGSQSEPETDIDSRSRASSQSFSVVEEGDLTPKAKRPRGRPRKSVPIGRLPFGGEDTYIEKRVDYSEATTIEKTNRRGRPKKVYGKLDGETQLEYLTRVARIQKKPLPTFAHPLESESPNLTSPHKSPKSPRKRAELRFRRDLKLRDWSEVLGSAALVGFSPDVIARATQRCADLFGEGMSMRTMVEKPAGVKSGDRIVNYNPGLVPDFGGSDIELSSDSTDDPSNSSSEAPDADSGENHSFANQKLYSCPSTKCSRHKIGYKSSAKLLNHVRSAHKLSKEKLEELMVESDDEMDGAVHVDRFLKPVFAKRGERAIDAQERKVGRWNKDKDDIADGNGDDSGGEETNHHSETNSESESESRSESHGELEEEVINNLDDE